MSQSKDYSPRSRTESIRYVNFIWIVSQFSSLPLLRVIKSNSQINHAINRCVDARLDLNAFFFSVHYMCNVRMYMPKIIHRFRWSNQLWSFQCIRMNSRCTMSTVSGAKLISICISIFSYFSMHLHSGHKTLIQCSETAWMLEDCTLYTSLHQSLYTQTHPDGNNQSFTWNLLKNHKSISFLWKYYEILRWSDTGFSKQFIYYCRVQNAHIFFHDFPNV